MKNKTEINSAVYTMQKFQAQMKGQAETAGFTSEEDVANWITESRREENFIFRFSPQNPTE